MIKITSISSYCCQKKLIKLATKSGFFVCGEKRHARIENKNGDFVTIIPRHNKIKKPTAESIIKVLIENGAEIEIEK